MSGYISPQQPIQPQPPLQPVQPMAKEKKPLYKRVWFWIVLVVAVFVIAGIAGGGGTATESGKTSSTTQSQQATDTQNNEQKKQEDSVPPEYKSALRQADTYANAMHMKSAQTTITTLCQILVRTGTSMGAGEFVVSLIATIIGPVPERRHCSSVRFARLKGQTGMAFRPIPSTRSAPYSRKCLNRFEKKERS